jgi:hypothetical protein
LPGSLFLLFLSEKAGLIMTLDAPKNQSILLRIVTESQQVFPDATVEEFAPNHAAAFG